MKSSESIVRMSAVVAGSVILVAILTMFMIFPIVFSFDLPPEGGPGLIFKTIPYLFAKLPGGMVLSTLFFTLFVFTALTSAVPLIEVVTMNLMELYKCSRKKAAILVGAATFVFGIPSALTYTSWLFPDWADIYGKNFMDTMNNLVSIWVIPIGAFLSAIFVGWVMDKKVLYEEFNAGLKGRFLWRPWLFFIRWIVPFIIFVIIIQKSGLFNFDRILGGCIDTS